MPTAIALRPDFTASSLRGHARRSRDAAQARRLLSLAVIYDGGSRSEAAMLGNVTLQIVRDWVVRFNAEGPDGLRDRKAPGPTPRLNEAHRAALLEIIECGPMQEEVADGYVSHAAARRGYGRMTCLIWAEKTLPAGLRW